MGEKLERPLKRVLVLDHVRTMRREIMPHLMALPASPARGSPAKTADGICAGVGPIEDPDQDSEREKGGLVQPPFSGVLAMRAVRDSTPPWHPKADLTSSTACCTPVDSPAPAGVWAFVPVALAEQLWYLTARLARLT
jgi:hypothetical protein